MNTYKVKAINRGIVLAERVVTHHDMEKALSLGKRILSKQLSPGCVPSWLIERCNDDKS